MFCVKSFYIVWCLMHAICLDDAGFGRNLAFSKHRCNIKLRCNQGWRIESLSGNMLPNA